jgi:hypothetical protein
MRLPTLVIRLKTGNEDPGQTLVDAGIPDRRGSWLAAGIVGNVGVRFLADGVTVNDLGSRRGRLPWGGCQI